jgi:uncharacterized protein (TIGR02147 family)
MTVQKILSECFESKKLVIDEYSLRDFSKFLEINPSTLGKVLKGERGLPKAQAVIISEKLQLKGKSKDSFLKLVLNQSFKKVSIQPKEKRVILKNTKNLDEFNIISQWEYFAILNVIKLKKVEHNPKFISKRLGISLKRTKQCIETLIRNKFISYENNKYKGLKGSLFTTNDSYSLALQLALLHELVIVKDKMELDVDIRHYRSEYYTVMKKDIKKIKKLTEDFYESVTAICPNDQQGEEVYLMASQFLPLTVNYSDEK